MKTSLRLPFLAFSLVFLLSISKDNVKDQILGGWKLTTWSVGLSIDMNNSQQLTTNLLEQTSCKVNETLSFDRNGLVISEDSFSPKITIRLKEGTADVYLVEEVCAEGVIGFATDYTRGANGEIEFNGTAGVLDNDLLTVVYKGAVKVYNEALTEVIESRDLTLVYAKIG